MLADTTTGGTPAAHSAARFTDLAQQLGSVIDELAAADLDSMVDSELPEVLVDLLRRGSQLEAVTARVTARLDASKLWTLDRSRTCGAWISRAAQRDRFECNQLVQVGRALRTMPHVEAAFVDGQLSSRHVRLLAKAAAKVPDHFPDDEAWLLQSTKELSFDEFVQLINHWMHWADPDNAEDEAHRRYRNRSVNLSPGLDGTGLLDVEFEPVGYEIFRNALALIETEFWEADWAEARQRLGDSATQQDLIRSSAQRRYDALIEMARRAVAMPKGARKPVPLVTVHIDHETLTGRVCELSSGTQVTPGEVLPLLLEAEVERAVFDSKGRVINLGRRQRLFKGGARRAVQIRDRYCSHPGCTVLAEYCQVDHILPWTKGGRTDHVNGQLLCPMHHRSKPEHESGRRHRSGNRERSDDDPDSDD